MTKNVHFISVMIALLMIMQSFAVFTVSSSADTNNALPASTSAGGNYFNMSIDDPGWDIYNPESITEGMGYRYGASIIKNDDGSIDAWFACKGDGQGSTTGILDFISYKRSTDGGHTWSSEKIVLAPTALGADCKSCCDPGVIYFDGYYYIGYTSTVDYAGYANSLFVARSTSPEGPFEKWNGTGWGGGKMPAPMIVCNRSASDWGFGEPTFVKVGDKLYIYYNECCAMGSKNFVNVCVADATDENWPATIGYPTCAVTIPNGLGKQSGFDVKYDDATGKFLGLCIWNSLLVNPYVAVFTSNDGKSFTRTDTVYTNLIKYAQNNGIMGDALGHFNSSTDNLYLTYAYGNVRGRWATRMAPVTITLSQYIDVLDTESGLLNISVEQSTLARHTVGITTRPHFYIGATGDTFTVIPYSLDDKIVGHPITDTQNVTFSNYNERIVSFNGLTGTILQKGRTTVIMNYGGFQTEFTVVGYDAETDVTSTDISKIEPLFYIGKTGTGTLYVYLDDYDYTGIRSVMQTYNGTIGEGNNNPGLNINPDNPEPKIVFDSNNYKVNFAIDERGLFIPLLVDGAYSLADKFGKLYPKQAGETIAAVQCYNQNNQPLSDPYYIIIKVVASRNPVDVPLYANGGSCTGTLKAVTGYSYGPLPTPTKANATFDGWYLIDGTTKITSSTVCNDPNAVLVAHWIDHIHSYELTDSESATCTAAGYNTYTCSGCGDSYTDTIPASGHSYSSNTIQPTCTEEGSVTYTCSVCGYCHTDPIPALGHGYSITETSATCTTSGYTTYVCTRCNDTYTGNDIQPLGHSYTSTTTTQPTCTAQGVTTYSCIRCTCSYTEPIDALGHNYGYTVTPPTCTTGGYTTYTCTRCGDTHTGDDTTQFGHNYVPTVTEVTCTTDGYTTYTCSLCGNTYTDNIVKALGHNYISTVTKPTCTAGGYTTYVCSNCSKTYTANKTAALGHSYGEWETITPATYESAGLKRHMCSRCGGFDEEVIPVLPPVGEKNIYATNYTLTITNSADIMYVRIASGVLENSSSIKNAPDCITLNSRVLEAGRDDGGNFNYELPDGGIYSVWYRLADGTEKIVSGVDATYMVQTVTLYGVTVTVNNLYGVNDMFIKKGHYTTYAQVKNDSIHFNNAKLMPAHNVKYGAGLPGDGEYTLYVRYLDPDRPDMLLYFNCEVSKPTVETNGRNIIVGNIDDVRVIRVAPGSYNTASKVKNAAGCRSFNASTVEDMIKDGFFTVQNDAEESGTEYSVAVEYKNLYVEVHHVTVNKKAPTYAVVGNDIIFHALDGMTLLRYTRGRFTTANAIKNAAGSRYLNGESVVDDTITLTNLSGKYTFLVQYDDMSQSIFTIDF